MADGSPATRIALATTAVVCVLAFGVTAPSAAPSLSATAADHATVANSGPKATGAAALEPAPAGRKVGPFAFLMTDDYGKPARWNPCSTIKWNWASSTKQERTLAAIAFARVSQATGLRFVYRAGAANITIRFGSLKSGLLGYGSFYADRVAMVGNKVRGWVATSGNLTVAPRARSLDSTQKLNLLMHEIGHIVGLAHVNDRNQVMFREVQQRTSWGSGDRAGFRRVGAAQGCIKR